MSPADARVLLLCAELERDWQEVARWRSRANTADPRHDRSLLDDAALALAGLRPALLTGESLAAWSKVMGFRYFLRHAYSTDLLRA